MKPPQCVNSSLLAHGKGCRSPQAQRKLLGCYVAGLLTEILQCLVTQSACVQIVPSIEVCELEFPSVNQLLEKKNKKNGWKWSHLIS